MISDTIAKLSGKLILDIEGMAKLQAFSRKLDNVAKKMQQFGKQYEQMSQQMAKNMGLDASKQLAAKEKYIRALERELRAEKALEAQRRKTFQAELKQQKTLKATGQKASGRIPPSVAAKQVSAVQAAKLQNIAQQAQPKPRGRPVSAATALHQQQMQQARLAAIHAKTQAATQKANAAYQATQTKMQRLQQQIQLATVAGQQKAAMHQARLQAQAARQAQFAQAAQQRAQRFQWAQAKQQHWLATRNNSGSNSPFSVVGAFTGALGVATASLYALGKGLGYANERVEQRQQGAIDAQSFEAPFLNTSDSSKVQGQARKAYIDIATRNATEISNEGAREFGNFFNVMSKMGKSADKIQAEWEQRQKGFRIAGLDSAAQRDMNREITRLQTSGRADAADVEQITDRFPGLVPYLAAAAMKGTKLEKASAEKQIGQFNADLKAGKGITNKWFEQAWTKFINDNQKAFDRSLKSLAAQRQLRDNQIFLQDQALNSSTALEQANAELIRSERELAEAMQPVKEGMLNLDILLTRGKAGLIRELTGKNADGTDKTAQQQAQAIAAANGSLILPVDPNVDKSTKLQDLRARKNDPVDKFWRFILGKGDTALDAQIAQYQQLQDSRNWGVGQAVPPIMMTMDDGPRHFTLGGGAPMFTPDQLRLMNPPIVPQVNNSFLPMDARPVVPTVALTPESIQAVTAAFMGLNTPDKAASGVMAPDVTVNQTFNIDSKVDSAALQQQLGPVIKSETHDALRDAFGQMRANQAERR
ncbi:hypothetical protein [Pseudomonas sp. W03]|uniref:hypothetical protein n=1 Tax=Pseudomonas sp. W03 TaxID=3090666 RepID=UPI003A4D3D13